MNICFSLLFFNVNICFSLFSIWMFVSAFFMWIFVSAYFLIWIFVSAFFFNVNICFSLSLFVNVFFSHFFKVNICFSLFSIWMFVSVFYFYANICFSLMLFHITYTRYSKAYYSFSLSWNESLRLCFVLIRYSVSLSGFCFRLPWPNFLVCTFSYRSYGSQTWPIKWNAFSSKQRSYRYCNMDALLRR